MKKILLSLLVVMVATPAFALTLAEKKKFAEWEETIKAGSAPAFQEKCGYELPTKLDEAAVTPFMEDNRNLPAFCDAVRDRMATMCGKDALSKEAIAAKIKSLNCMYKADAGKGEFAISEDGALTFSFDMNTPNIGDATQTYLENNL